MAHQHLLKALTNLRHLIDLEQASPLQHWAPCSFWKKLKINTCDCPVGKAVQKLDVFIDELTYDNYGN